MIQHEWQITVRNSQKFQDYADQPVHGDRFQDKSDGNRSTIFYDHQDPDASETPETRQIDSGPEEYLPIHANDRSKCKFWKETRSRTRIEYEAHINSGIPLQGNITETRWCEQYKKSIPLRYEA